MAGSGVGAVAFMRAAVTGEYDQYAAHEAKLRDAVWNVAAEMPPRSREAAADFEADWVPRLEAALDKLLAFVRARESARDACDDCSGDFGEHRQHRRAELDAMMKVTP